MSAIAAAAAILLAVPTGVAFAGEAWELQTHKREVHGTRDLEAGRYDEAIHKLERWLKWANGSKLYRTPVLINLCAAYTAKRDFASAEHYCDAAVDNGRSLRVAYNNRGVMHAARGDYLAAAVDFESAMDRGARGIAKRNLLFAYNRIENLPGQTGFAARQD